MDTEQDLIEEAFERILERWPESWGVPTLRFEPSESPGWDALVEVYSSPDTAPTRIAVEAKRRPTPAVVDQLSAWAAANLPVDALLVVSDWVSPRTREAIIDRRFNYADLTGNLYLSLDEPKVFIRTDGASKPPGPKPPSERGLRGAKGAVVARTLADVAPPYTGSELAAATGLSASFVSRILAGLEREGIIQKKAWGPVLDVDVRRLIQRWAEDYSLLTSNACTTYVFPAGPRGFEAKLPTADLELWAVTGSLGAARLAPIAAPATAIAYVDRPRDASRQLGLLPTESGTNVILARPYDPVAYKRRWSRDGITYVSPSQLAVDCLTGPGRMPNEGAELLRWMEESESAWRARSLDDPSPLEIASARR